MEKLREKVVLCLGIGNTMTVIACNFGISRTTVHAVRRLYEETGSYSDQSRTGRPCSVCTEALIKVVKEKIDENP